MLSNRAEQDLTAMTRIKHSVIKKKKMNLMM